MSQQPTPDTRFGDFSVEGFHVQNEGPVPIETFLYVESSNELLAVRSQILDPTIGSEIIELYEAVEESYLVAYMHEVRRQLRDPGIGYAENSQWACDQLVARFEAIPVLPNSTKDRDRDEAFRIALTDDSDIRDLYVNEWGGPVDRQSAAYQVYLEVAEDQIVRMLAVEKEQLLKLRQIYSAGTN